MRSAVDCGKTSQGDVREEIAVGNACGGKSGSHGSKAIPLSHAQGVEPAPSPVSAHIPPPAGEQQRLVLQAPDMRSKREGPQAGEPSKCLSRQSNREGLPRDLLITSCQRLHKKILVPRTMGHRGPVCDQGRGRGAPGTRILLVCGRMGRVNWGQQVLGLRSALICQNGGSRESSLVVSES